MRAALSPSPTPPPITRLDKLALWAGLGALSLLAWGYLARMPAAGAGMAAMAMPMPMGAPSAVDVALIFLMWATMMAAMMVPTVAPVVLMYAAMVRAEDRRPTLLVWCFVAGYIAAWSIFSVGAALVHELLLSLNMLDHALKSAPGLGAVLLIGAGIYQLSPLKSVCLSRCRSPLVFFMTNWRHGFRGAFSMGLRQGIYCVGCCWLLMGLLFVVGVMNLAWVAALSALVLVEKVSRFGPRIAAVAALVFIAWGAWLLVSLARVF